MAGGRGDVGAVRVLKLAELSAEGGLNGGFIDVFIRQGDVVERLLPYILQAGAVIPAALITGIRSDLPGQITAQVTENVYDSPTGSLLLIPQGTRIIGQYDDDVTFGQRRVLLVWNRLILPGGRSIVLERLPGADASGYAGLEDCVDYHWWDLMRAAGLSTLLAVGAELATSDRAHPGEGDFDPGDAASQCGSLPQGDLSLPYTPRQLQASGL